MRQEPLIPGMATRRVPSIERKAFVDGLFDALQEQLVRHTEYVTEISRLQGQLEVSERALIAVREHLLSVLEATKDELVPEDWREVVAKVRFIGAKLGVACAELLYENGTLSTQEMEQLLNAGQFRFRTGTPLREIHAALIRNPRARREDDRWHYVDAEAYADGDAIAEAS